MESGVLERIRGFEVDIEKSIDSIVRQQFFTAEITNARHRILIEHFIVQQLAAIKHTSDKLLDAYLDEDEIIDAERAPSEGQEVLAMAMKQFEAKIADIREYHQTYRDLPPMCNELLQPDPKLLENLFSLRERFGSRLDLEAHYNRYSTFMVSTSSLGSVGEDKLTQQGGGLLSVLDGDLSSRVARLVVAWPGRLEYFRFVPEIPIIVVSGMDAGRKLVCFGAYRHFVSELLTYLIDFHARQHPLSDEVPRLMADTENDCEEFWTALVSEKNKMILVAEATANGTSLPHGAKTSCEVIVPPPLRKYMKNFSMWPLTLVDELVEAAADLQTKFGERLAENLPRSIADVKHVCMTEAKIAALLQSLLFETLQKTEKSLLRDYSKTAEELELDRLRAENEFTESLDSIQKHFANSMEGTVEHTAQAHLQQDFLKPSSMMAVPEEASPLPGGNFIGEDGRPIARWLVQLQQLEKTFVCEVCGGTVYKGPKVFREHFGAERHAEGLRRLGITQNLKDYEGIASIRTAIDMRDRLSAPSAFRRRLRNDKEMEEIQDGHGKVLTNKEYMNFQRRRMQ